MTRIVLHRKPHPTQDAVCTRWFTYRDREFGVGYGGPGWGYEVFDLTDPVRLRSVSDNYFTLHDIREKAAVDIDSYLSTLESCPHCAYSEPRVRAICSGCGLSPWPELPEAEA
jgi:hypothetical protein